MSGREIALLQQGHIVNVITTRVSKIELQERYPDYVIRDMQDVPMHVKAAYQYWDERP